MTADNFVAWLTKELDTDAELADIISGGGYAPDVWEIEPSRSGRWSQIVAKSRTNIEPREAAVRESDQAVALVQSGRLEDRHIALWDPQRVIDDINAKRAILALHARTAHHGCAVCDRDDESCGCLGGGIEYPCRTVKFLALPYADRPGYLNAWRP